MSDAHELQSKVQVIRNTAHRPSTQASYTAGSGTTIQENQPAAKIAASHTGFSQMVPNVCVSGISMVQVGNDSAVSRLEGEIVSHYTIDDGNLKYVSACNNSLLGPLRTRVGLASVNTATPNINLTTLDI